MIKSVRRGYSPDDEHDFKGPALEKLKCGAEDLYVLLNRGYPIKGASTFVGNHYQLSERQILSELKRHSVQRGVFWLDAPVSNSGRLKTRIAEIAEEMGFEVGIERYFPK